MKPTVAFIFAIFTTLATVAQGTSVSHLTQAANDSTDIKVSLITCAPGSEIYSLEGHSALRIRRQGIYDVTVNWGVFDFNSPNFVYRFVKGETDYMAVAVPTDRFLEEYRTEGRRVTEQVLTLPDSAAYCLEQLITENIKPQNRIYRYNYVLDNCATRPVALINKASNGAVNLNLGIHRPKATTFRSEMSRYHRNYPWYQFGIDLALGAGIDKPISTLDEGFAPIRMKELVDSMTLTTPSGAIAPLVAETNLLVPGTEEGTIEAPTPWYATPMVAALALLVVTLALVIVDIRRRKLTRWYYTAFYLVAFAGGCIITFLVFISSHYATSPNWNLVWLNPFCIIPAIGIWIKKCKKVVYSYQICNFALLILCIDASPWLPQLFNPAFYPLMLSDLLLSGATIYCYRKK